MPMAWEAVNFPSHAPSAVDSQPWAANILFIVDIKQMASGRMEMDSTRIFHVFHYIDCLTRVLTLKKTRNILFLGVGRGWQPCFSGPWVTIFICVDVSTSPGQSTLMRAKPLFLYNFVGFAQCCYGHPVLLRTKATQAFYVAVKTLCQPPRGGNRHANQALILIMRLPGKQAASVLRTFQRFEGARGMEGGPLPCHTCESLGLISVLL